VSVPEGTHRGALKEELSRAYLDPTRTEALERQRQANFQSQLGQADQAIAAIEQELRAASFEPVSAAKLTESLQEARSQKQKLLDQEDQRKREDEQRVAQVAREAAEFRKFADAYYEAETRRDKAELRAFYTVYEGEFKRGEDWSKFHRKPTRKQFDAVYDWLDANKPGWSGILDIIDTINLLFPELKR